MGSLDRATQWLAYRAASSYDPSSRSLRDRKEKEQEKGITKKGGRTTKKEGRATKRDCQKEIGITAKAYSHLLKTVRWQDGDSQFRCNKDYGSSRVDKRFIPAS